MPIASADRKRRYAASAVPARSALRAAGSRPQGGRPQPLARGSGVGTPFWRLNAQREPAPMLRLKRQQNPKGRGPSAKGTHATYFSKAPGMAQKGTRKLLIFEPAGGYAPTAAIV